MPHASRKGIQARVKLARVARLATADARGRPSVVPVCYSYDGRVFYTPLDRKRKRVAPEKLARVRNIRENPNVALLVDDYREDWSRLWYVLVRGRASLLRRGREYRRALGLLRSKYRQYTAALLPEGAPLLRIRPSRVVFWDMTRATN